MKDLFLKYWNECYMATSEEYPNSIFHIHDPEIIRQKKLYKIFNKIENINISIAEYKSIRKNILFYHDINTKIFYVNYNRILLYFSKKYKISQTNVVSEILKCINEDLKIKDVRYCRFLYFTKDTMVENDKLIPVK